MLNFTQQFEAPLSQKQTVFDTLVLTNSVKISNQTKADFGQLNLPQIHEKTG